MRAGKVSYWPPLTTFISGVPNPTSTAIEAPSLRVETFPHDFAIKNKRLIEVCTTNSLKRALVQPIMAVNLPVIENTSLADYAKIAVDEPLAFDAFKSLLTRRLIELDKESGKKPLRELLHPIQSDVMDGVRKLDSDLRGLNRKSAFRATGAIIGTASATLVAVYGEALRELVAVVGASGSTWAVVAAIEERMSKKEDLATSEYYFAWLLHRKSSATND